MKRRKRTGASPVEACAAHLRRLRDYFVPRIRQRLRSRHRRRLYNERAYFGQCENIHDLPPIFHYWSGRYLVPKQARFGITDPEHFFFKYTLRQSEAAAGRPLRVASLGAGHCDVEVRLAQRLVEAGQRDFTIDCIDINEAMLERGRQLALATGVGAQLIPVQGDFNRWQPQGRFDVVIANQALHHVLKLERLFGTIRSQLIPGGVFLTSDTIGRNGHLRWPEARAAAQPFWDELPESYRYNRQLQRLEAQLMDHDCSADTFEGVRAQDILPLLTQYFHFELFLPFASLVLIFIDRPFGHNFDVGADWDRDFVDRVNARDEEGTLSGELKPTQMLAVLRNEPVATQLLHPTLTPEFCIRWPGRS